MARTQFQQASTQLAAEGKENTPFFDEKIMKVNFYSLYGLYTTTEVPESGTSAGCQYCSISMTLQSHLI